MYYKGSNFLDLINNNFLPTKPTYTKDGTWLKHFEHSNTLYVWATRAITNYAPIEEYCLRFFPRELFKYLYRNYPIKSKHYILYNCRRYNKFWNSNRELLKNFVIFLEFNVVLWDTWTLTIFLFLFFYFSDFILIFFFFYFSFGWWKGMWHCSHMTCHMMWRHRPRTWWKDLEYDIRAHIYNMVALRQTWGCSMDNRTSLIISSTDQALLWDALDMNNFYFLFLLFSDFIGIFFSFSFLFF